MKLILLKSLFTGCILFSHLATPCTFCKSPSSSSSSTTTSTTSTTSASATAPLGKVMGSMDSADKFFAPAQKEKVKSTQRRNGDDYIVRGSIYQD